MCLCSSTHKGQLKLRLTCAEGLQVVSVRADGLGLDCMSVRSCFKSHKHDVKLLIAALHSMMLVAHFLGRPAKFTPTTGQAQLQS